MNNIKVLVTGAAGFVGSRLSELLILKGYFVIGVDCFLPDLYSSDMKRDRIEFLSTLPRFQFLELDLRHDNLDQLPKDVHYVINEAAMPGLLKSWESFDVYSGCNISVVSRLLDHYLSSDITKFLQISTSSVYGEIVDGDETSALSPVSPYGVTKLAAENLVMAYKKTFNFPAVVLRYFSVYGPGQRPDMGYSIFINAAIQNRSIFIHGDGTQTRTNTYVDDVAIGTIQALGSSKIGEVYNICGEHSLSVNESLAIIARATGRRLDLRYISERPGDQKMTRGTSAKAYADFGFTAKTTPDFGLSAQVEWQKKLLGGK